MIATMTFMRELAGEIPYDQRTVKGSTARKEYAEEFLRQERIKQENLEIAIEALKVLAFIPDKNGFTYGSTLHDAGHMADFAEKTLNMLGVTR